LKFNGGGYRLEKVDEVREDSWERDGRACLPPTRLLEEAARGGSSVVVQKEGRKRGGESGFFGSMGWRRVETRVELRLKSAGR